jgi:DNA mismatch endonuclease (patch repair protein)
MRNTPTRDTPAEVALRRILHARGYRYRVDFAPLSGVRRRADIVFPRERVAVFVDGCFWHNCPTHGSSPRANAEWWRAKLTGNDARDRDTDRRLRAQGWLVLRVWEHESAVEAAHSVELVVVAQRALRRLRG